jgi:hypothetical protein
MRFKDWYMLSEAGHTIFQGGPQNIIVMFQGKPTPFQNVKMIDPRFELASVPKPPSSPNKKSAKFLGEIDFALPLVGPQGNVTQWINSKRDNMLYGTGTRSFEPAGVQIPLNWANHAQIIDASGRDMAGAIKQGAMPDQRRVV